MRVCARQCASVSGAHEALAGLNSHGQSRARKLAEHGSQWTASSTAAVKCSESSPSALRRPYVSGQHLRVRWHSDR
eukprot:8111987-Alexandrium_andersonii.AAC.1